jgi:hypothetical protein
MALADVDPANEPIRAVPNRLSSCLTTFVQAGQSIGGENVWEQIAVARLDTPRFVFQYFQPDGGIA